MAAIYPSAGSAYTYVGRALNPDLGILAGWAMLLDYRLVPLFCVVFGSLIVQRMIPHVPYVVITACFAGGMTYLNVRGIRATARANQLLMTWMTVVLWCVYWAGGSVPSFPRRVGRIVLHFAFLQSA